MKNIQKFGGTAALYMAGAFLAAMAYFLLFADYTSITDPLEKVRFLAEHRVGMELVHVAAYIIFSFALVVFSITLHGMLKIHQPSLAGTASVVGFIWAGTLVASGMVFTYGMKTVLAMQASDPTQAAAAWVVIESVANALSSGNGELLGGVWTLLNSLAAFQLRGIPKVMNILGLVVGMAGLLSAIPLLNALTAVFGLLQLIWFIGWGFFLLRQEASIKKSSLILKRRIIYK